MKKFLSVVLLSALLVGCGGGKKTAVPEKPPAPLVAKATSKPGVLIESVAMTGHLEPLEQADVTSKLTRVVEKVQVREGDSVYAGQPLIYLDQNDLSAQIEQARAGVSAAQANVRRSSAGAPMVSTDVQVNIQRARQSLLQAQAATSQARLELDDARNDQTRKRTLFSQDAIPKTQVEQAELRFRIAEKAYASALSQERSAAQGVRLSQANTGRNTVNQAEVAAAQANVGTADATLQAAAVQIGYAILSSPINGVVVERKVEPGRTVGPQDGALLRIVNNRELEMVSSIAERYLNVLQPGLRVEVSGDADPKQPSLGRLHQVVPAADPATHTVKVRIRVSRPEKLVSGMFARASLKVCEYRGTLVPRNAVLTTPEGSYVLRIDGNKVRRRAVSVPYQTDTQAVISSGLEPGAEVVTAGGDGLKDGAEIRLAGEKS